MTKRRSLPFFIVAVTAIAAIGAVYWLQRRSSDDRPRIKRVILLTIDTLRADALPMYGNDRVATPALSALASEGAVFDQTQTTSPWTIPSTTSILTGLPPLVHGLTRPPVDGTSIFAEGAAPLADLMSKDGYHTVAIGYNPFLANSPNLRRGFRDWLMFPEVEDGKRKKDGMKSAVATERLTDLATGWLEAHAKDDFFLWLHYYDPHNPYVPPQEHFRAPSEDAIPEGHEVPSDREAYPGYVAELNKVFEALLVLNRKTEHDPVRDRLNGELRKIRAAYHAIYEGEVRYIDAAIGTLVAKLKALGIYDETLIVVTSDHGEEFWEHGGLEHGHALYQEVLRVPLIIRPPGGKAVEARVDDRVSILSVLPTICDFCGIEVPMGQRFGPSLAAWVRGGEKPPLQREFVAGHMLYGGSQASIILDDKKYVYRDAPRGEEVYDLRADPNEANSIAAASADFIAEARRRLEDHRAATSRLKRLLKIREKRGGKADPKLRELLKKHGYLR